MTEQLKALPDHATITLSSQQYNDLIMRILRVENFIMSRQRETLIQELSALEDTFELPRTREKRLR